MYSMNFGMSNREDVLASFNLGAQTLTMRMPLARFIDLSDVANNASVPPDEVAQRTLDKNHALGLAVYILKGIVHASRNIATMQGDSTEAYDEILERMGDRRYYSLQPIVVNVPASWDALDAKPQHNDSGDELTLRVKFPPNLVMWVIDGQHRRYAMNLVLEFLRHVRTHQAYPKKGSLYPYNGDGPQVAPQHLEVWRNAMSIALSHCTVTIEAHIDLSTEQQRQIFHDLNNLGKKVSASMSFDFDSSNPINNFIKEVLIDEGLLSARVSEKDITDWREHNGSIARKDVVAVCSILFLNKTNPKTATPVAVDRLDNVAREFWEKVSDIPGFGEEQAKLKTVAAQPVVLKALAKLTHDFAVGRKADPEHLRRLLDGIAEIDFSHENRMWDFYDLTEEERARKTPGLESYLPRDDGNRDVGGRDESGKMRFGAKHNDIYPILGDMIRWRLDLPSRHEPEGDLDLDWIISGERKEGSTTA